MPVKDMDKMPFHPIYVNVLSNLLHGLMKVARLRQRREEIFWGNNLAASTRRADDADAHEFPSYSLGEKKLCTFLARASLAL